MILRGDIGGGERLNEMKLAEQLGVSRAPVREAAQALARDGLLQTVANQGVYVRELTLAEALELYDLRAMLAGYICADVARQVTPDLADELSDAVAAMEQAATRADEQTYFELNLAFHGRITEMSGAHRAAALYASIGKEVRLMRQIVLSGKEALLRSNSEHRRIAEAIARGDAAAAQEAGRVHHLKGKERLRESVRS